MNHKAAILYGVGIWVFTFVVAMLAFPLRANERLLFESIMPVALTLATTFTAVRCFRGIKEKFVWTGFCLGLIFFAMNFLDYLKDIGVTYLLIIIIPTGFGYLLEKRK